MALYLLGTVAWVICGTLAYGLSVGWDYANWVTSIPKDILFTKEWKQIAEKRMAKSWVGASIAFLLGPVGLICIVLASLGVPAHEGHGHLFFRLSSVVNYKLPENLED